MKKFGILFLKIISVILLLGLIVGLGGWTYFKSNLLNFEKDFDEKTSFNTLASYGESILDRNSNGRVDVYEDHRRSLDERVEDVFSQMTVEEKLHLLKGSGLSSAMGMNESGEGIAGAVGTIVPTPRLGLPTIYLSDGPAGLRIEPTREGDSLTYYCTAFPIASLLSSTWNTTLVEGVGNAMGQEALEYGIDVILGPGANIMRHPFNGRNFEYFSEDPLLSGKMGAAMVNGIQSNGVGTSVKHFVANTQETNRNWNDARISERALREIYLRGFEIIVKDAAPWTLMSSYNRINGLHVAQDGRLLTDILRGEWGFEGLVMSDWFGGINAVDMINAGNDLLEPGTKWQWKALKEGYANGKLNKEAVDTSVKRILRLILGSKKMQSYEFSNQPDLEKHAQLTRQAATEGMVLLKNNNQTLPIKDDENLALLGVASYVFIAGGTGSGDVNEAYSISLEQGMEYANAEQNLQLEEGFRYPNITQNRQAKELFDAHKMENSEAFIQPQGFEAMINPFNPPQRSYSTEELEDMATEASMAVITIGRNSGEGVDRVSKDDFELTAIERDLIEKASAAFHARNKKVVVVLNVGGVIETNSWKHLPDAILLAWQGGQEGGNSVVDLLLGKQSPSGRLPMTFPLDVAHHGSHKNFPTQGVEMDLSAMLLKTETPEEEYQSTIDYTNYDEGIFVGYRHFDHENIEVSYPFGYGLSYTRFSYGEPEIRVENDTIKAMMTIKNTGDFSGKEVIQVYASKLNSTLERAPQELVSFAKTKELARGEQTSLSFAIPLSNLHYWDESKSDWNFESGLYDFKFGTSSRDVKAIMRMALEVETKP